MAGGIWPPTGSGLSIPHLKEPDYQVEKNICERTYAMWFQPLLGKEVEWELVKGDTDR